MKKDKSKKKDLEEALEKISPIVEETIEKNVGIALPQLESDISDQLQKPHLDIYVPSHLSFRKAKKKFKKEFFKRELELHLGNVSQLAKVLGVDRRSVHRTIKDLHIDTDKKLNADIYYRGILDKTIRTTLDQYKEILHPHKLEHLYEEVGKLSRNIAKHLPRPELTWKQAEKLFEKDFIKHALEEVKGNVRQAALNLNIRVETLHRKIKKLGIQQKFI